MRDQSFNLTTLSRLFQKTDFRDNPALQIEATRHATVASAVDCAEQLFQGQNPLTRIPAKAKTLYQTKDIVCRLILRKLQENIHGVVRLGQPDRNFAVTNLIHLVSEGVPYRLYRLDIKSFYESIRLEGVLKEINGLSGLSPLSKKLLNVLFDFHHKAGGQGLPRGTTLSATLSELMMRNFDSAMTAREGVYFYYRYVDDIILITNGEENQKVFLNWVTHELPPALALNEKKKQVLEAPSLSSLALAKPRNLEFEYLGYRFSISDPLGRNRKKLSRDVTVDIAPAKIAKIKTRVVRSLLSFCKNGNYPLLELRIKFLTSNIRVKDPNRNTHKLAGIYHNYPQVTGATAKGLAELDRFLRIAVTSTRGRVFSQTARLLSPQQKTRLLKFSFVHGHRRRLFSYFPPPQLPIIVGCWSHGKS